MSLCTKLNKHSALGATQQQTQLNHKLEQLTVSMLLKVFDMHPLL